MKRMSKKEARSKYRALVERVLDSETVKRSIERKEREILVDVDKSGLEEYITKAINRSDSYINLSNYLTTELFQESITTMERRFYWHYVPAIVRRILRSLSHKNSAFKDEYNAVTKVLFHNICVDVEDSRDHKLFLTDFLLRYQYIDKRFLNTLLAELEIIFRNAIALNTTR